MATEIELKAHVASPGELETRLYNLAAFMRTFEKSDVYFFPLNPLTMPEFQNYGIRIRREITVDSAGKTEEANYVTYKCHIKRFKTSKVFVSQRIPRRLRLFICPPLISSHLGHVRTTSRNWFSRRSK